MSREDGIGFFILKQPSCNIGIKLLINVAKAVVGVVGNKCHFLGSGAIYSPV